MIRAVPSTRTLNIFQTYYDPPKSFECLDFCQSVFRLKQVFFNIMRIGIIQCNKILTDQ